MKLFLTYSHFDLADYGRRVRELAEECSWEVVDGNDQALGDRFRRIKESDALLLLSARYYGKGEKSDEETDWDLARKENKIAGAMLVRDSALWPLSKVQTESGKQEALTRFHEKVRATPFLGEFEYEAASIDRSLKEILDRMAAEFQVRSQKAVFVVWDFEIEGLEIILSSLQKNPPSGFSINVLRSSNQSSGEIFRDNVLPGIRNNDQILIVTDNPNSNVGFEAGLAIGLGKPISLVLFSSEVPEWVKQSAFKGMMVNRVRTLDELREVIKNRNSWYEPGAVSKLPGFGRTLFLATPSYVGSALIEEGRMMFPFWRTTRTSGFNIKDFEREFLDVAQVVWCLTGFSRGLDFRDGTENTANSLIYGWLYARALRAGFPEEELSLRCVVLRQEQTREVVDVGVKETTFGTLADFSKALQEVAKHDFRLPKAERREMLDFEGRQKGLVTAPYRMVSVPVYGADGGYSKLWVGVTQVTNRQYELFCAATGRPTLQGGAGGQVDPDNPVVEVSLEDAEAFCSWAGLELPDPPMWNYFAKAGASSKFWWGDDDSLLGRVAWLKDRAAAATHLSLTT